MTDGHIKSLVHLVNKRFKSNDDFVEFQEFAINVLDFNTICSLIDEKIYREDGPKILEYIMVGLSVKPDAQKTIEKFYEYVLNAINTSDITEKMIACLISRLSLELNKLSTEQLIKLMNMCKKDIESSNEKCMQSWKELTPQILKKISDTQVLETEGKSMTGADYKEMFITDICRYKVQTNITVALALMFRRTQLTEKEHELVIRTLCSNVSQMKPQEIPPVLQQILHFSSSGDFLILFCTLQKYFDDNYHLNQNNDKNNVNGIEVNEKKELLEAETTVLFLLEDYAKVHSSFLNDITKYMTNCVYAPNMVFGPFMLSFLLTMSCCTPYETIINDLIRKLIVQSFMEEVNIQRSFWLKINYTDICDVYTQFQVFIKSEISGYEKVFKGLVNLGVSFLGLGSTTFFKKNTEIANKFHQLGLFIIVSLVNKRSFIIGSVLRKLTNLITSNPTRNQYLECLHKLCKNQKANVLENNTHLIRLFKDIPVGLTDKVIFAVMPVLKLSTFLRDNVIIILRKELMSRDYELRHSAVSGFIEILCSFRLDNFNTLSQNTNSQDSWPGLLTQFTLDRVSADIHSVADTEESSDSNQTICLEILDILKTCFFQRSEIKRTLYRGLTKVTSHSTKLCECVNSLLLDHLSSWCNKHIEDNKRSLKFDKSVIVDKCNKPIIQEPLEDLVLLSQHVVVLDVSSKGDKTNELKTFLDQLVNFYCECNTDEIKVNESDYLLDIVSNIADHQDVVKQILCCYQALIIYIVNSWRDPSQDEECSKKLKKLFYKYINIVDGFVTDKTNKKKEKGDTKKKTEATASIAKFIEPAIHMDFDALYRLLSLLTVNVDWNSEETVVTLKSNIKLWEFVLKLVQAHLIELKTILSRDVKPMHLYENLCKLTKLFYDYFFFDICTKIKSRQTIVELGLECYLEIIKLVSSYYKNLDKFLSDSNRKDLSDEAVDIFSVLSNIRLNLNKVLEMNQVDTVEDEDSVSLEKIECHLIGCVSVICNAIKSHHNEQFKIVLIWLSVVAEKYSLSNLNNSKEFLTLMLEMHSVYQEDPIILATLIKNLCSSLGPISNSHKAQQSQLKTFRIITTWNRSMVCQCLCQCLLNELFFVSQCLLRIKGELNSAHEKFKKNDQDRLLAREKAICHRVVLVMLSTISFTKSVIPLGPCTEIVFNLLYQVYHTINMVTKHFLARSSYHEPVYKQALFGKLSEIVNNQMSPSVSKFIMFVEHDRPLTTKEKNSVQLKNQTRRQANYIPKVVTELELFVNLVTKLGKKCKDQNLVNNLKLTSSRDFRLNLQKVQDMLSKQNDSEENEEETTTHDRSNESEATSEPPKKKPKSGSNDTSSASSPVY